MRARSYLFLFKVVFCTLTLSAQECPSPPDFNHITPCYANGSRTASPNEDVIVLFNHTTARGTSGTKQVLADYGEVGTVWGLAYKSQTKKLYAAAFLKRHCDLSPDGLGAIYEIDVTTPTTAGAGTPTLWMNLNSTTHLGAGATLFPTESAANRGLAGFNDPSRDAWAYTRVGRQGLGDIEITQDGTTMYVMDLTNRQVLEINMATKTVTNRYATNAPSNYINAADRRPFAIKHYNGELYIGMVSSGETANFRGHLRANVLKLSGTSFTNVFEVDSMGIENPAFPLNNGQAFSYRGNSNLGGSNAGLGWYHLSNADMSIGYPTNNAYSYIQNPIPMISDIEFDNVGNMVIGIMDLAGHMMGAFNYRPFPTTPAEQTALYNIQSHGDIVKAVKSGTSWVKEPAIGKFYNDMESVPQFGFQKDVFKGGLVVTNCNGTDLVVANMQDPFTTNEGGTIWMRTSDGLMQTNTTGAPIVPGTAGYTTSEGSRFRVYISQNDVPSTFGKAAGLGDLVSMFQSQCVAPTSTATATNPTCAGSTAQSNGTITISGFAAGQRYQYSTGATFNSGAATPASITTIPAGGVIVNTLANTTQQYTVRIYDAADNTCFVDRTISIVAVICGVCSCSEYIYLNEPGGGGKVHKYLVNADGTLTEINPSGPWYNNNTTGDELDEPHGIAFDLNGYLYIAETSSGDVRKLDCDGNIFPESNFVIAGEGGWNFASIGNNVYLNRISQASVGAFNVCDGSYVNGVDFCDDENNDWGFYYDKRTGYFYSAYKGTGANTENKAAILRYTAADFGSGTCIPEWISPGDGTLTPGVKETVGNTFVRGLTTDAQSNVYVVERQSNNQIARILKYNANGEFVAATAYDNTDGDGGWYLAAGVAYSETCNCLQVSTASSNDDCISTFDLDLNYMGPGVPGNAGGFTEAKAIGILKECCPNLLPSFTKNVCATVGAKYFLNVEAFDDCDGIVCGTSWMPQGTLTGMTFDPCDNSVTITGEGCGTFTLNLAASPTKGCPAQTSVFTICAGLPIATVTATQGTCTGSMSNNNATINITAAINANRAGISLGSVYSGPTYNGVGSIAIIGGVASFPNLMHNTQYTVRIFNRRNNCFEDYTLTTPNIICSSCNLMVTCSPTPQSNCTPINGSATTMVTGGQGTITYLWSSGETTSNISNKAAGTYTVTVTDSFLAGCTSTCQAVITTSVTLPTAQCSTTDNTNCISPNGSATVTTNGNQILWSTGGTNATITGLSNGTYTVTVTNTTTGCTNTCASVINNATVNPTCNITTNSQPSCANLIGGDITVIPSPAGIYTYNWSDIGLGSANRTGLTGGSYTVTVTNTTSNCTGVCNVILTTPTNCCNINAILPQNIECLDNGTPALITDNRIRFSANVTNTNTSLTGYNVTINGGTTITPNTNLPYGITQFTLGPGTAGGGATFTITVTDSATPGCTQTFQVTDPGTCTPATPECPPIKCGTATIQVNGN